MRTLNIKAEINAKLIPVGTIIGNGPDDARFQYISDYLNKSYAQALSISLPIQEEPFSPTVTACFFEGLLPEGFTRRSVAQWLKVDEGDYLSILHGLGRECLGAICVQEDNEDLTASYERISTEHMQALAEEGATKSAELVTQTHLSLTGASGKVGLYYEPKQNVWYLPRGMAPSTHIVKQSHVRLNNIVTNEQLALQTASRCGIPTVQSFIVRAGDADQSLLFATQRYDRIVHEAADKISGLARPLRLHQEDFAQAMGIPASQKYERDPGKYMRGMFDIIRRYSANPIVDQINLWEMIVFNVLIGNTDAHVKNFSLLYSADWRGIRLAPAYDIISTTVYDQSTRNLAFSLGGVYSLDDINRNVLKRAAAEAGLSKSFAMSHFDRICNQFEACLSESARELSAMGFSEAEKIRDRVLTTGGAGKLL